jgi:crotonobetainyl-CoA:carnitine CoA-transferase CaiB-like acyl-CoA transferase
VVDLSLLEPMLAIMGPDVGAYAATGVEADPGRKIASPRGSYRCKDGLWVSMSGSTDTMARRVFEAIGRRQRCFDDPRFASNAARLDQRQGYWTAWWPTSSLALSKKHCLALYSPLAMG